MPFSGGSTTSGGSGITSLTIAGDNGAGGTLSGPGTINFLGGVSVQTNATGLTLTINGQYNLRTETASYSATDADRVILADPTAASLTITLPGLGVSDAGKAFSIKALSGTSVTNTVTLTSSSGTIDGSGSVVLSTPNLAVTVIWDGANYNII